MNYLKLSVATLLFFFTVNDCTSQSADEVVTNYINAIGGSDNWKKVNSVFYEGNLKVHGAEVKVYKTILHAKGMRQNMNGMGMNAFEIMTPTEGWKYLPFQGHTKPEPVNEDDVKQNAYQFDAQGVLIDYKSKGHTIEYLGKESRDGKDCYKLRVKHKGGKIETIYFDVATALPIVSILREKVNGQDTEVVTKYSDYQRHADGVFFPMTLILPFGEMKIIKLEINKKVDENIFKPIN